MATYDINYNSYNQGNIVSTYGTLTTITGYINNTITAATSNIYTNTWSTVGTSTGSYITYGTGTAYVNNVNIINSTSSIFYSDGFGVFNPVSKKDVLRDKLRGNLKTSVKSRINLLDKALPQNEQIAIETLREEISETEYRKYLKHGFVLVKGKSGDIYQVFRNRSHTKVWRGGKLIEEICVRIKDSSIPQTDNVIAFKNMIEASEDEFKALGNRYKNVA